jgi:hypothetical protein
MEDDREKDAEKRRQLQKYLETEKMGAKQNERGGKRVFKSETQQLVWEINACQNSQDLAKAMSLLQGLIDKNVPHLPNEVMSHLQALPGVNIEMTLEVQVRAPGGIDEATARIVLENSAALKVEKPGLY